MSQFVVPFILLYGLIEIKPLPYSSRILPKLTVHVKTFNPEYWIDVIQAHLFMRTTCILIVKKFDTLTSTVFKMFVNN